MTWSKSIKLVLSPFSDCSSYQLPSPPVGRKPHFWKHCPNQLVTGCFRNRIAYFKIKIITQDWRTVIVLINRSAILNYYNNLVLMKFLKFLSAKYRGRSTGKMTDQLYLVDVFRSCFTFKKYHIGIFRNGFVHNTKICWNCGIIFWKWGLVNNLNYLILAINSIIHLKVQIIERFHQCGRLRSDKYSWSGRS